ncbi:stalk domain-containing protein [Thermotalea metallivorans]|uniref:Copper amine oxidase-like N-terminal domain-containing protein n=1 Tax=Thermotalea metallivorans TaxID=520762 RepID=A0A140L6P1_9FIRM|nr:stalk domain-containing protein [Thermotalea metallivorans]KXG76216.1 hypothetical protein AN619_11730 [Thermotalea metallivorans]
MKKKLSVFIMVCLILLTTPVLGFGKSFSKNITAWFYDIKVNLDGKPLIFASQPFIFNNHTYVSINDIAANLGYTVQWDDKNKVMHLTSNQNQQVALSTMKYELDRKNMEINSLKYQLEQKNLELAMLKEDRSYGSSSSRSTLDQTEKNLNNHYYRYRDDEVTLRFSYSLSRQSNDDIVVRMYGDFRRSYSSWKNRDSQDFRDFILSVCKEVDRNFDDDVTVYVYDQEGDWTATYTYSDSNNRITSYSEY